MLEDLRKKMGDKWLVFDKLHQIIMFSSPSIDYRVFPIYVSYFIEDKMVFVIYYRGKTLSGIQLDVGFSLKDKPNMPGFVSASYMQYPGINYSIKINSVKDITKEFKKIINKAINY
ncbi:MAG: hypothetical protein Q8N37_00985 [bacterium]|nr:hypothetical protein [bacterium]